MCCGGRGEVLWTLHEVRQYVDGDGEDDGAVVFCSYTVKRLKVAKLGRIVR